MVMRRCARVRPAPHPQGRSRMKSEVKVCSSVCVRERIREERGMGGLQCVTERLKYSRTSLRERCEVVTVVTGSVYG